MAEDSLLQKAGNGLLFNISWLAIVYSQSALIAGTVVAAHLLLHMLWIGRGQRELMFIAAVTVFGVLCDHLLFFVQVFTVSGVAAPAPVWLSCLWPVLATTLAHAFGGLQHRLVLAAVLGAVGGAASYYAGTGMSAVDFSDPVYGPIFIAGLWAILFPALALGARLAFADKENAPSYA
ncbi:MAG: DUF2878 domain-containing protein [Halieaceae bacterium]